MKALEILQLNGIDITKPILEINRIEALESLLEAVDEFCPNLRLEKMSKEDLETLFGSLRGAIINFHPEN
ncbi:MAG: hypothetical protein ISS45_09305 [Candidatus Omnitrophica bacterium]|nr:hypothetical protein [Candidatus Omnitrophota bacterium]